MCVPPIIRQHLTGPSQGVLSYRKLSWSPLPDPQRISLSAQDWFSIASRQNYQYQLMRSTKFFFFAQILHKCRGRYFGRRQGMLCGITWISQENANPSQKLLPLKREITGLKDTEVFKKGLLHLDEWIFCLLNALVRYPMVSVMLLLGTAYWQAHNQPTRIPALPYLARFNCH